jgi:mRNA interferase HicA
MYGVLRLARAIHGARLYCGKTGKSHCVTPLQIGHKCPILDPVRGSEFIRRVQAIGKERRLASRVDEKRGKGSHVTLYFGDRRTVVRNPKDELKTGTLHAMCKQLGIKKEDL